MDLWHNVRLAARLLVRDRGFTAAAVVALALGIAATNTGFALVNGIFLRDLPFAGDPDRVVGISTRTTDGRFDNMSFLDVQDLRASARAFDGIGASDQVPMTVADERGAPDRYLGAFVSANSFSLIGQRPILGRDFTAGDDDPGADPVVILGSSLWRNRYGGDPAIVGRTIRVNGVASTVIGVMADGFGFPERSELWQPLGIRTGPLMTDRDVRAIDAYGRMSPGVTIEQAATDIDRVMRTLAGAYPQTNDGILGRVRPYRDLNTGGPVRTIVTVMMAAVTFLLLIACANVANLMLARGAGRTREIAVQVSLGATRGHITRQLLVESALLAVAAGIVGLVLAAAALGVVQRAIRGTGEPYWLQFPIDWQVLGFAATACIVTAVLAGLLPALRASNPRLVEALADNGRTAGGGLRNRRWMGALVVLQLTLTVVLLTGGGLMVRNVTALANVDAGLDMGEFVTLRLDLPERQYPDEEARRRLFERLEERFRGLPGVRAGLGATPPLGGALVRPITIVGDAESTVPRPASTVAIGATYFEGLAISPVLGRPFDQADGAGRPAALINERFASQRFGGQSPIGRQLLLQDATPGAALSQPLTIVGVMPNIRHEENDSRVVEPVVYVPLAAASPASVSIIVQSDRAIGTIARTVRAAVAAVDPDLAVFDIMTMDQTRAPDLRPLWVVGSLFGVFAVTGLALSAIGLYGVTAYSVAQRTRELGVRVALGAGAGHVWWVVMRRAAIQLAVGLTIGSVGAVAMGQTLQSVLSGVDKDDPLTMATVAMTVVGVTLAACVGPARRITDSPAGQCAWIPSSRCERIEPRRRFPPMNVAPGPGLS